ncbi:MAG TPA: cadherin-like domain-containing protein, partial [Pirellulales bacterium]
MSSQPGDWVGGGLNYSFTSASAAFSLFPQSTAGGTLDSVSVSVTTPGLAQFWELDFGSGNGAFTQGTYNAQGAGGSIPYLNVSGDGAGAQNQVGNFTVFDVTLGANGSILDFDAGFNQWNDGSTAALTGIVDYHKSNQVNVLANDTSGSGQPLSAILVSGPQHGALTLNADGTFSYTPNAGFVGTDSFQYEANDGAQNSNVATISLTVAPQNQAPSFTAGPTESAPVNSGPQSIANWATGISAGPPSESNQILTFSTTNNNSALFSTQPTVTANGTLDFTPAPGATGTATVTVTLMDNGGTANGGQDWYTAPPFTITITGTTHPLTSIPALSSLPSAPATLYLNFGGDTVASWGTESPGVIPAYDQNGDATTFSDAELASIKEIWTQVANAFSPFNINVTTVKPASMAHGQTMEVDIGGTGAWDSTQPEGG